MQKPKPPQGQFIKDPLPMAIILAVFSAVFSMVFIVAKIIICKWR